MAVFNSFNDILRGLIFVIKGVIFSLGGLFIFDPKYAPKAIAGISFYLIHFSFLDIMNLNMDIMTLYGLSNLLNSYMSVKACCRCLFIL